MMKKVLLAAHRKQVCVLGYLPIVFLFLLMPACFASSLPAGKVGQASSPDIMMTSGDACPTREEISQKTQKLQMPFIANDGQMDEGVKFYANTFGGTVFVTRDGEIVYALPEGNEKANTGEMVNTDCVDFGFNPFFNKEKFLNTLLNKEGFINSAFSGTLAACGDSKKERRGVVLKEDFSGGEIKGIKGEAQSVTKVSYFKGNDPSKWRSDIATYEFVDLGEVYKGVNIKLRAYGSNVEKLFCVKPGASPEQIKVQLDGGKSLQVNNDGQLEADTELGTIKFTRPVAYQEIDGKRVEVEAAYVIRDRETSSVKQTDTDNGHSSRTYGFTVASYDKTKDLIIDPLLASTYVGGSREDTGNCVAIDADGNVYVTGKTESTDFPTTPGAYQTSYKGGADVYVSRLSGDLTKLLASTFLGGSGYDHGSAVAIDTGGNVYVTGAAGSADFPTTPGAYQTSFKGGYDLYVSKLSGDLTKLLASTFVGGSGAEGDTSSGILAIDAGGNVYVTGYTNSTNFPTTPGAYQTSFKGGTWDIIVSRLSGDLTKLLASTYLGGSGYDVATSVSIDAGGNVYVTGWTQSTDFPTAPGAYQTSFKGVYDAYVSRFSGDLTKLLASTYVGGSGEDSGSSVSIDAGGNVYVAGTTNSTDFPTTPGAYQASFKGVYDALVLMLSGDLTKLLASTFLGGVGQDVAVFAAIDAGGNVYVTGMAGSSDFPTTPGAYQTSFKGGNSDVYVSRLSGDLTKLLASTYLGGIGNDGVAYVSIDAGGNLCVTGSTNSTNFPTTPGAYQNFNKGGLDVFVSRLDAMLSDGSAVPPKVTTGAATSVTKTSATLNGTVNANGLATTAWYNYGLTSGSYTGTSTTQSVSGSNDTTVSIDVSGLSSSTTYYYRIAASSSAGTSYGSESPFNTLAPPNTAPVANAGTDQSVHVGNTVTLDGSGSTDVDGNLLTYSWAFTSKPSGSTSTLVNPTSVNPTFTVDKAGTYVVRLVVNDSTVNSDPDTVTVSTLNSAPVANAGTDQSVYVANTVTLDGSGSTDVDGNLLTYSWAFISKPSGSTATLVNPTSVNPTFMVDKAGTYVASLIVNDGTVDSTPDTVTVSTLNSAPVANAGTDQSVYVANTVTLDGTGSTDIDGNVLTYSWAFTAKPSGSTSTLVNPTSVNPTFMVDKAGTYVVSLVVNDGTVNSAPGTVTISTINVAPIASAGMDQSITIIGTTVQLDGTQSYDPDGDAITYQWTFVSKPAGSTASLANANTAKPTFVTDVQGDYVAQLIVRDPWIQSTPDTVTVGFVNIKPVANAGSSQSVTVGSTVTLNGSGSTDANGDSLTYKWTLTSVPAGSYSTIANPTAMIPTFVPDKAGTYVVQLVVNDGYMDSDPSTIQVQAVISPTTAITVIQNLQNVTKYLNLNVFKNSNMQNALINKLNAVIASVQSGNYTDALGQLQNDILGKTDGCANAGAPDNNDWIKDFGAQGLVYPQVLNAIAVVRAL